MMSQRRMIVRPVSRRTLLRGAGVLMGLPFLEAMRGRNANAQSEVPQRFLAFFCPCGTEPNRWEPSVTDAITEADLTECLIDLKGFEAEQEWPASGPVFSDITWVTNVNHEAVCADIHNPSMALSAHHARGASPEVTPEPTLDQYLAARIQADTPYRSLTSSATGDSAITQGFLSFRENGQSEAVFRNATKLFDSVFSGLSLEDTMSEEVVAPTEIRGRKASILDYAQEDAIRLGMRLGAADKQRVEHYLQSVRELEMQIQNTTVSTVGCTIPENPETTRDMHTNTKLMLDLTLMAFQCDLTRVGVVQYSNSWDVNYGKYDLPDGCGDWSDHFISHKLDDNDRATDLDGLNREEAMRIANARVVQTSRFKARRFANVVSALKAAPGANGGTLFDETLALYCSENGDGDSHSRKRVPYMIAGKMNGFVPGRVVSADGMPTGALHASIMNYYGLDVGEYGDPASGPIPGL